MKQLTLLTYIFLCTGGTYAQERQNNIVAEVDFNLSTSFWFSVNNFKPDTLRATLLITRGHLQIAHEKPGYVVISKTLRSIATAEGMDSTFTTTDTIYLDDRRMVLKAPVKVWAVKIER